MQALCRNLKKIWYANKTGVEEVVGDDGAHTGVFKTIYTNPVAFYTNVSTTAGLTNNNLYAKVLRDDMGQRRDYTATINPLPSTCDLNEESVLWIDVVPEIKEDGSTDTPYDYVIIRISEALNWRACQVQHVDRANGGVIS